MAVPAWRLQYASDLQDMVGLGAETRQGNGKLEPGVAPGERWAVATRGDRRLSSSGKISKQIVRGPARNLGRCPRSSPGVSPPTGPSSYLGQAEVPWARGIAPLTGCLLLVSLAVGQGVYVLAGEDGRACRLGNRAGMLSEPGLRCKLRLHDRGAKTPAPLSRPCQPGLERTRRKLRHSLHAFVACKYFWERYLQC